VHRAQLSRALGEDATLARAVALLTTLEAVRRLAVPVAHLNLFDERPNLGVIARRAQRGLLIGRER
jgi:hypothetical protein